MPEGTITETDQNQTGTVQTTEGQPQAEGVQQVDTAGQQAGEQTGAVKLSPEIEQLIKDQLKKSTAPLDRKITEQQQLIAEQQRIIDEKELESKTEKEKEKILREREQADIEKQKAQNEKDRRFIDLTMYIGAKPKNEGYEVGMLDFVKDVSTKEEGEALLDKLVNYINTRANEIAKAQLATTPPEAPKPQPGQSATQAGGIQRPQPALTNDPVLDALGKAWDQ